MRRDIVPVALAQWEPANTQVPGALIHAQALRTLRHGGVIQPATALARTLVLLATLLCWLGGRPLPGAAGVLHEILAGRLRPGVGGERRRVCVLFSDIRDFTGRSEREPPERILALLNRYFEDMTAAVHAHNGTVDKFIGDGLMAFFSAPNPSAAPVQIGIGLHAGDAIIGHVGSRERHEYTAIGDTVNIAARLEGLTKEAGFPIVCTQTVVEALCPDAGLLPLGQKPIKGHTPVAVFGWRPDVPGGRTPNDTA